jgi:hypothetical protein
MAFIELLTNDGILVQIFTQYSVILAIIVLLLVAVKGIGSI